MKAKQLNFIFIISIILSFLGIASECIDYYQYKTLVPGSSGPVFKYSWIFRSIYLNLGLNSPIFNIYNIVFYILLFFGALFFYSTKGKEVRFIRLFYSVLLISNLFILFRVILTNTILNFNPEIDPNFKTQFYLTKTISTILIIGYILLGYKVLKLTSKNRELHITEKRYGEKISTVIEETGRLERWLHHILDTLIILFLFFSIIELIYMYERFKMTKILPDFLNNQFGALIFIFLLRFIYYPFFEKIFGSTPAKFLTNSRVITKKAEIPNTSKIFERTLYRHIPFDAVSFLFGKGFHDKFSQTFVVKEKDEGIKTVYLVWVVVLCFVVTVCYMFMFVDY